MKQLRLNMDKNAIGKSLLILPFCCLNLFSDAVISLFSASCALAIYILINLEECKKNLRLVFFNPRLVFSVLFFFYINVFPFVYFIFGVDYSLVYITEKSIVYGTCIANTALIIFLFVSTFSGTQKKPCLTYKKLSEWVDKFQIKGFFFVLDILMIAVVGNMFSYVFDVGLVEFLSKGGRALIIDTNSFAFHPVLEFMCIGYCCFATIVTFKNFTQGKKKALDFFRILLIAAYWFAYALFGNRVRFTIYLIFCVLFFLITHKGKIKIGYIFIASIVFLIVTFVGVFRIQGFNFNNFFTKATIIRAVGEFLYPIQTLYISIDEALPLNYGATYLNFILYFIPRAIFESKPVVMSHAFSNERGLPYILMFNAETEAYINFGFASIILLPLLLNLYFSLIDKLAKKRPALMLLAVSSIFIFARTDFSLYLTEMLGILLVFLFFEKSLKKTSATFMVDLRS